MSKTAKGGAATINGILYQMLYALFTASKLKIGNLNKRNDVITRARIILEPIGGGGDQQQVKNDRRIIEQLKARTINKPWSLREIVEEVLPDLYKAVDLSKPDCCYRFITESKMGKWGEVFKSFTALKDTRITEQDPDSKIFSLLDDNIKLKFQRQRKMNSFWGAREYTVKTLFEFILEKVKPKDTRSKDEENLCRKKLFHLLQNFEYKEDCTQEAISKEIDNYLVEVIPFDNELQETKRTLLCSLLEKASDGNVQIDVDAFFKEHSINAVPLRNRKLLAENSAKLLDSTLRIQGYAPDLDARPLLRAGLVATEKDNKHIFILHGESGNGKSWSMYSLAKSISGDNDSIVIFDNAKGDCEKDLNSVATKFNHDIWGHDYGPSLDRIAKRLRDLNTVGPRWVFIDGIQDPTEANDLILQPWESWGIKLAMSCQEYIFDGLKQFSDRFNDIEIEQFSLDELDAFLRKRTTIKWHDVPEDIRDTIRKPILADIYCRIKQPLQVDTEYQLYSSFWKKINLNHRFDDVSLQKLLLSILKDETYPWTGQQMLDAGIEKDQYERLNKTGWLRETADGRYEVPHSRLLSWAIAESIVNAYQNQKITEDEIAEHIRCIFIENRLYGGQNIGYVPMDVVWLFTNKNYNMSVIKAILNPISSAHDMCESLYANLLPTIGIKILPFLFDELIKLISEGDRKSSIALKLIKGIEFFKPYELKNYVSKMLLSDCKLNHRYAAMILSRRPLPDFLDRLWKLHCEATENPEEYFQYKNDSHYFVYRDTFGAIKACVQLNPTWIIQMAENVSPREPVHDLAYLLANINDGKTIWLKSKKYFFEKISSNKERALATNICKWRDNDGKQWCIDRVAKKEDLLGPSALKALTVISPNDAIRCMAEVPNNLLYFSRNSAPKDLLIQMPKEANIQIMDILKSSEIPLWSSLIYQGNESLMKEEVYDFILDELDKYLDLLLEPSSKCKKINLYPVITMIAKIGCIPLLKTLQRRKGGRLEESLKKYLNDIGPRKTLCTDSLEREPILDILYKMGGQAFIDITNEYLRVGSKYGKYDALKGACKRHDHDTKNILRNIALSEDLWDDYPVVQSEAAYVLCVTKEWTDVFEYIEKWGLETSSKIAEYLRNANLKICDCKFEDIQCVNDLTEGIIMSLGFAKRYDKIELIRKMSQKAELESDMALACNIAFGELVDEDSIDFLRKQLYVPKHSFSAQRALAEILEDGNQKGAEYLFEYCEKHCDVALALYLINKGSHVEQLIDIIIEKFTSDNWFEKNQTLTMYYRDLLGLKDTQLLKILNADEVKSYLRNSAFAQEGSVWLTGSKHVAIELLSKLDKKEAFEAARKAFEIPSSHDRNTYPYLLLKINRKQAVELLIEQLKIEENKSVCYSICRALSEFDIVDKLKKMIKAKDYNDRKTAYSILSWQNNTESESLLYEGLADPIEEVSDTSRDGILRYKHRRNVKIFINSFNSESRNEQKWIYLDILLTIADPGDEFLGYPYWCKEIWEKADICMRNYMRDQLKERRKELKRKLEKR